MNVNHALSMFVSCRIRCIWCETLKINRTFAYSQENTFTSFSMTCIMREMLGVDLITSTP